jgi:hypothetical protein
MSENEMATLRAASASRILGLKNLSSLQLLKTAFAGYSKKGSSVVKQFTRHKKVKDHTSKNTIAL